MSRLVLTIIAMLFALNSLSAGKWWWTDKYPWVYDSNSSSWIYLEESFVYSSNTNSWVSLEDMYKQHNFFLPNISKWWWVEDYPWIYYSATSRWLYLAQDRFYSDKIKEWVLFETYIAEGIPEPNNSISENGADNSQSNSANDDSSNGNDSGGSDTTDDNTNDDSSNTDNNSGSGSAGDGEGNEVQPFDPGDPPSTFTTSSTNLEMIWVNPGTFLMGSPQGEHPHRFPSEFQHEVTLDNGFYLGKFETSQGQYSQITGSNPSHYSQEEYWIDWRERPVESLEYSDIESFLNILTENEREKGSIPDGWSFQLPTEAEWEYACRAGTTSIYPWGTSIDPEKANYNGRGYSYTIQVNSGTPNNWGFHNMIGNVAEWTSIQYQRGIETFRGKGGGFQSSPELGQLRVASEGVGLGQLRVASNGSYSNKHHTIGFRVALKQNIPEENLGKPFDPTDLSKVFDPTDLPETLNIPLRDFVGLELILVQPGTFMMGGESFEPIHQVEITKPFYLGRYEFTRLQWQAIEYPTYNLSDFPGSIWVNPLASIDYDLIETFIGKLNSDLESIIPEGWEFRLPTEAQWEFACKAGTSTWWSWGPDYLDGYANWDNRENILPSVSWVGSKEANPWGFYDMHGNVGEWCSDWDGPYTDTPKIDPTGPETSSWPHYKIYRGGHFKSHHDSYIWSHYRHRNTLGYKDFVGFRISLQKIN